MPNKHLLLLVGEGPESAHNHNASDIVDAFESAQWRVTLLGQSQLRLSEHGLQIGDVEPNDADLVWHLGFGTQASFLDRMQLLTRIPANRLVTTPEALVLYHGKTCWLEHAPETRVSNDAAWLSAATGHGDWIAKPTAGSHGRGVSFLAKGQELPVLAELIGDGQYALVQRQIEGYEEGELRVLMAGGQPIGCYRRQSSNATDHRHNLSLGGEATLAKPNTGQFAVVRAIGKQLVERRIGFAAIDLIGQLLVEVNVVNPGGIRTLIRLGDAGVSERLVAALEDW